MQSVETQPIDLHSACFMLVVCLAYSSAPKMEVTHSSETSVGLHLTARRYMSEDENLTSYNIFLTILWHVDPLLGNDLEISNYTTAVAK
jgi:hypothetical protein